jgi:transposase InsO family protein
MDTLLQTPFLLKPSSLRHQDRGAGNCYDNATMEAFFSTLKTECFPDS